MRPLVLAVLAFAATAHAQLPPGDALKSFELADPALRVELVAAEPLVMSPCAMAFDERGRLFVAENRGYPNAANPPQGDIAMLEDTDGDGRMDKRTVFADALTFPNGVMPWRGGVIVTCAPDVLFFKDTDGDGKADERRVLLTGFATSGSTQLRVNCPTLGPDGWIYFAAGLSGGDITSPEHPARPAPRGPEPVEGLKMTGDLRWKPQSGEIENVDGRSQFGMSFDDFGRRFICMNRVPVQHVVLSSKILARNPHLAFSETVQDCNERSVRTGLRGGGDGVRLFPISQNLTTADSHAGSFSAACAITIWRGGALPEKYRGGAFTCDPTANIVHVDRLDPRGATFAAVPMFEKEQREFLASRDDWHRPVFLTSGPDGALYICDMYRKTIEHPEYLPEEVRKRTDFESGKEMGRIWRVTKAKENASRLLRIADSVEKKGQETFVHALPIPKTASSFNNYTAPTSSDRHWRLFASEASLQVFANAVAVEEGWPSQTAFRILAGRCEQTSVAPLRNAFGKNVEAPAKSALLHLLAIHRAADAEILGRALRSEPRLRETALLLEMNLLTSASSGNDWSLNQYVFDCAESMDPRVRFAAAIQLGNATQLSTDKPMASIAAKSAQDRWTRSALLSGTGNDPQGFLSASIQTVPPGAIGATEFFSDLGHLLNDGTSPLARLAKLRGSAFGEDPFGVSAALLVGLADSSGKAIEPVADSSEVFAKRIKTAGLLAGNSVQEMSRRLLAIRFLSRCRWDAAREVLLPLATEARSGEAELAAIRAVARFGDAEIAPALFAKNRWSLATPEIRETILSSLLAKSAHLSGALSAVESETLPAHAVSSQRRALFLKHQDAAIRERAEKLFGTAIAGDRTKAFDDAKAALALKANAERGRELFKTLCASCHRLDREGFAVGPDLFDMRNQPKESILFHIVVPEAEVAPAFAAYLVETKDGRSLSGLLTSETATSLTLRMPLGAEETILRANTTRIEAMPGSLMPAGLEAAMSRQDLADLLGYLKGER